MKNEIKGKLLQRPKQVVEIKKDQIAPPVFETEAILKPN